MKVVTNKKEGEVAARKVDTRPSLGIDDAVTLIHSSLADRQVERQTISLIEHLAERVKIAEANQAALMGVLRTMAEDSADSRSALLEAINSITERLSEPPQVNVTVEPSAPRRIEFERDARGHIKAAEEVE